MPKIKQVASKKPRQGFMPPNRAVKSVSNNPENRLISPKRLLATPLRGLRATKSATPRSGSSQSKRRGGIQQPRSHAIRRHVARTEPMLPTSRFINMSIPKRAFQRLVRDIVYDLNTEFRFQLEALTALQTVAEDYLVSIFEDAAMCMRHANRKTLFTKDLELATKLRRIEYEPI